ncbi:hypothetical protein D9613_011788 [Agrocybe pediades]|uniref:Uncharacterized protein n=1 Tax=Agrocybe pediades TaxID=84607 RepID=A0A8H4QKE1_9AGAR|nr:hypothetical protein D9613_011788 [Agrocybe pediades]
MLPQWLARYLSPPPLQAHTLTKQQEDDLTRVLFSFRTAMSNPRLTSPSSASSPSGLAWLTSKSNESRVAYGGDSGPISLRLSSQQYQCLLEFSPKEPFMEPSVLVQPGYIELKWATECPNLHECTSGWVLTGWARLLSGYWDPSQWSQLGCLPRGDNTGSIEKKFLKANLPRVALLSGTKDTADGSSPDEPVVDSPSVSIETD